MAIVKAMYKRFIEELESQVGFKVGKLTLTDDNGSVSMRVTPKLAEVEVSFTDAGNIATPPPTGGGTEEPPGGGEVITIPTDDGGIIVIWGEEPEAPVGGGDGGVVVLSINSLPVNVYRSKNGGVFSKVASNIVATRYTDTPLTAGTYQYYIVTVDANGKEGIPSKVSTITI